MDDNQRRSCRLSSYDTNSRYASTPRDQPSVQEQAETSATNIQQSIREASRRASVPNSTAPAEEPTALAHPQLGTLAAMTSKKNKRTWANREEETNGDTQEHIAKMPRCVPPPPQPNQTIMDSATGSSPLDQQPTSPNSLSNPTPVIFESLLLSLPKELRDNVYGHVHSIAHDEPINVAPSVSYNINKPNMSLLLTSRFVKEDVETFMDHYLITHPLTITTIVHDDNQIGNLGASGCYGAIMDALSLGHKYDHIALSKLPPDQKPAKKLDVFTEKMPFASLSLSLRRNAEHCRVVWKDDAEHLDRLKTFYTYAILHLRTHPTIHVQFQIDESSFAYLKRKSGRGRRLIETPCKALGLNWKNLKADDLNLIGFATSSSPELEARFNKEIMTELLNDDYLW
jgi:hypothetical protein